MASEKSTPNQELRGSEEMREFLDSQQYSEAAIEDYQLIFGQTFVSVGGRETTLKFLQKLNLKPGERVLDVGCGLGGNDFCMVELYGVNVVGIDTCTNMIKGANDFLKEKGQSVQSNVEFRLEDATTADFPASSFDVIFSREVITHIEDKAGLFQKFYLWLKPGGRLLINDQWRAEKTKFTPEFEEYVKQRHYFMRPGREQGQLLEEIGFKNVVVEDMTREYETILRADIDRLLHKVKLTTEDPNLENGATYQKLLNGWRQKLARSESGNQHWGILTARKD